MIIERLVVGPIQANCYLVGDPASREGLVIDPGGDGEVIVERIKALGLRIGHIVLTHGHFDHTAAAEMVKSATGARLAVHQDDLGLLNDDFLPRMAGFRVEPLPAPEVVLRGWEDIAVGALRFTILHLPGHSPGGIALYSQDAVFTGDSLFAGGIGRTDLPGGDYDTLIDSLNQRLLALDDDIKVYPGHGPDTTIGTERRGNPFLVNPPRREC
ncbi:putative metallo-beta-lactamase family protein [Dehalogenimonas lykanthroporepellens BL-DC-9]|nr:putative metallo-beta-lactamase family protein [Dehalogenimonas lykanthroporepellens BL-DC-9]